MYLIRPAKPVPTIIKNIENLEYSVQINLLSFSIDIQNQYKNQLQKALLTALVCKKEIAAERLLLLFNGRLIKYVTPFLNFTAIICKKYPSVVYR